MTPDNFLNIEQGSDLWAELRCGMVTASRAADVIAVLKKGGEGAARAAYRHELICERLTGQPYPQYVTREMQWGLDQEQYARAAYELERDVLVETMGFVLHPTIAQFGCSPDGLVGDDGLLQIKCPTTSTHVSWILAGTIPVEHCPQMLAEMACTERKWCDFVSFDPRMPKHLQLFVRRFQPDGRLISALEGEVVHFNREIEQTMKALPAGPQPIADVLEWPGDDEVEL